MHLRGVATPMISANKPYHHHHHIYIYNIRTLDIYTELLCDIQSTNFYCSR